MSTEDIKITPYKCRTLYYEYKQLRERKKTIVDFIIKADLLDLYRELEKDLKGQTSTPEFIHICMTLFMKIETLYNSTTEPFQNYMDGIGTIKSCNDTSAWRGEKSCQEEIVANKLTSSYVLNYIYFALINNKVERNKLNRTKMLEEIKNQKASLTSESIESALATIHVKVKETSDLLEQMRQLNINFDTSDIMSMLDGMQTKMDKMNRSQSNMPNKSLSELKEVVEQTDRKLNDFSEITKANAVNQDRILTEVITRLKSDNLNIDRLHKIQEGVYARTRSDAEQIDNMSMRLNNSIREIEQLMSVDSPMEGILQTVRAIQNYTTDIQQGIKRQALTSKEMESKVNSIEEGVAIIKKVLGSINEIMQEDILISLARTRTDLNETVDEVQNLGTKYKGIRGGAINEHIS